MRSNGAGTGTTDSVMTDLSADFRAVDRLPLAIKRLLWDAPVSFDAKQFLDAYRRYGLGAENLIRDGILEAFPGFTPLQPKPRRKHPR